MLRILFILIISSLSGAQTDWEYWQASEPTYVKFHDNKLTEKEGPKSFSGKIVSRAKSLYSFLISDLDGDNCPFHPTCSEFFVESAQKTNLVKSALMFADRFTRDMNLGKGRGQYLFLNTGRFYDPVDNYLLKLDRISNIPLQSE